MCAIEPEEFEEDVSYESAMKTAHDSRAEARRQLTLRDENYEKAAKAFRAKNTDVAAYYAEIVNFLFKRNVCLNFHHFGIFKRLRNNSVLSNFEKKLNFQKKLK